MLGCKGLILRPRQNFSLQYHYKIKQTSDENIKKHQLGINTTTVDPILNSLYYQKNCRADSEENY